MAKILISCVGSEFKSFQVKLASQLTALPGSKNEIKVREDFQRDNVAMLYRLASYIRECDLVICLVGDAYGEFPSNEQIRGAFQSLGLPVTEPMPERSYAQWEYHLAQLFNRRTLVYLATPETRRDCPVPVHQSEAEALQQREHLDHLAQSCQQCRNFADERSLVHQVLYDLIGLDSLTGAHPDRLAESIRLLRHTLAFDEENFGPDDSMVSGDLVVLAQILQYTNHTTDVEALLRRALDIDERCYGPDHINIGDDLSALVTFMLVANRLKEAEPLARRALAIEERCSNPDDLCLALRLLSLSSILQRTDRAEEAEKFGWRALELVAQCAREGGSDLNPQLQTVIESTGALLQALGHSQQEIQSRFHGIDKSTVESKPSIRRRYRPVIRVFVSSTFSDLKQERDVLQREVFPRLEQFCLMRGFQFQAIDLRWGVPGEAGLDHRTMQICFDELSRAQEVSPRPNFLVLLGDRYGWRPLAETLTEAEFQRLEESAAQLDNLLPDSKPSKRAGEILHLWYRRDENADPPAYLLRSRFDSPDEKDYSRSDDWDRVEARLWSIINHAFPSSELTGRFNIARFPNPDEPLPSIVKFQTSATEQEIWRGALAAPNAAEHVVAWYRTIRNRDMYAADPRGRDFFEGDSFLREAEFSLRERLETVLVGKSSDKVAPVEVDLLPTEDGRRLQVTSGHLKDMADAIEQKLLRIIAQEIAEYWRPEAGDPGTILLQGHEETSSPNELRKLELEEHAHRQFGASCAPPERFLGREKETATIAAYLNDEHDHRPLIVCGPSGVGKTALIARCTQSASSENLGRNVLVRFLGTTPQSSNLRSLLTSLCRALRQPGKRDKEVPADLQKLQQEFDTHLAEATADSPIVLFLDGLDQLDESDNAHATYWLRSPLPPHVKAVVSCLCDPDQPQKRQESYLALQQRNLLDNAVVLESLTYEEAARLLNLWLGQGHRRLTTEQQEVISRRIGQESASHCRRPLYLRILFDECRLWPSFRSIAPADVGANTEALLFGVFDRLADRTVHGCALVESTLSYIASARRGLSENEILEILWNDPEYRNHLEEQSRLTGHEFPIGTNRIPVAIWSRLRHDLDPFLTEQAAPGGVVITSYHRAFTETARAAFLSTEQKQEIAHRRLADYFDKRSWFLSFPGEERDSTLTASVTDPPDARKACELPWQLLQAARAAGEPGAWNVPVALLRDMEFVEAKCRAGLVFELQEDYRLAISMLPEAQEELRKEGQRQERAHCWTNEIIDYARKWNALRDQIQRYGTADTSEPSMPELIAAVEPWTDEAIAAECWRMAVHPSRLDGLRIFAQFIESELYTISRFAWQPGFVLQRALSTFPAGMFLNDANHVAARFVGPFLIRRIGGANLGRPALLRTLAGHTDQVMSVSITPDGRRAVSGGWDRTIRIWDLETGQCLQVLSILDSDLEALSVTPDVRIAALSQNNEIGVWDLKTGLRLYSLAGHRDSIRSISLTPDGLCAVSAGKDMTVRIWDLEAGKFISSLAGHTKQINSVAVSCDGRRALSGGDDQVVLAWDLWTGTPFDPRSGHRDRVTIVLLDADGKRAISGSSDGTLRTWNVAGEKIPTVWTVHPVNTPGDAQASAVNDPMPGTKQIVHLSTDVGVPFSASREYIELLEQSIGDISGKPATAGQEEFIPERTINLPVRARATSDGRWILTAYGAELRYWDLTTGECRRILTGHGAQVNDIDLTPDGRHAVSASSDHTVRFWNLESGMDAASGFADTSFGEYAAFVCARPGARYLVYWNLEEMSPNLEYYSGIKIWDTQTSRRIYVLDSHYGPTTSVSMTPDGRYAVSSGPWDPSLIVWDLQNGEMVRKIKVSSKEGYGVVLVQVMPDGTHLICWCNEDKKLHVFDFTFGRRKYVVDPKCWVDQLCCLSDPEKLLIADRDHTLRILDLRTGNSLMEMKGHTEEVTSLCLTPDGKRAVSASEDETIRVWSLETGRCLHHLKGHGGKVTSVNVTSDGRWIISASRDDTVRVWDMETGECVSIHSEPAAGILTAALVDDGGTIFVGSRNRTIFTLELRGSQPKFSSADDLVDELMERESSSRLTGVHTGTEPGKEQQKASGTNQPSVRVIRSSGERMMSDAAEHTKRRSAVVRLEDILGQLNQGRFVDTLDACNAAVALEPDEAKIYALRAQAHAALGDIRSALEDVQKFSQMLPADCPEEMRAMAANLEKEIRDRTGEVEYVGAIAFTLRLQAILAGESGQFELAESKFREAIRFCSPPARHDLECELAELFANWAAHDMDEAGEASDSVLLDTAIGRLEEALRLNPSSTTVKTYIEELSRGSGKTHLLRPDKQLERAWQYLERGEATEAVERCNAAAAMAPDEPSVYFLRAQAYLELGEVEKAREDAQKLLQMPPNGCPEEIRVAAASLLQIAGQGSEAYLAAKYWKSGDDNLAKGKRENARENYEKALSILELARREGRDHGIPMKTVGVWYRELGDLQLRLGDPKAAEASYQNSIDIRAELLKDNPDSAECVNDLSKSYGKLGTLYLEGNDPENALDCYTQVFNLLDQLEGISPGFVLEEGTSNDTIWGHYLEKARATARALSDQKKYPAAARAFQVAITHGENLCRRFPHNSERLRELMFNWENLGDVARVQGELENALLPYTKAHTIAEEIRKVKPDSTVPMYDLAYMYAKLGELQDSLGEAGEARSWHEKACHLREALRVLVPESNENARNLAGSYVQLISHYSKEHDIASSLGACRELLKLLDESEKRFPGFTVEDGVSNDSIRNGFLTLMRSAASEFTQTETQAVVEEVLQFLISRNFELPGTYCHLARLYLMTDREREAASAIEKAWNTREQAPAYIIPRILFLQLLLAVLGGADARPFIGQLKTVFRAPEAHQDWLIQPVLDRMATRLLPEWLDFLQMLSSAIDAAAEVKALESFSQWRDTPEVDLPRSPSTPDGGERSSTGWRKQIAETAKKVRNRFSG